MKPDASGRGSRAHSHSLSVIGSLALSLALRSTAEA